jgi:two-component system sensor histidine kinase KdpD
MNWKRIFTFGHGFPFAIASVVVATTLLLPLRDALPPATVMIILVPVIIGIARVSGVRVSATAAVVAFLLLDLQFVPPYYRLTVTTPQAWIGLVVFLIVALVAGQQAGQLRSREHAAIRRQNELELLNHLSFRIASEKSAQATAEFVVRQVAEVLGADRVALHVIGTKAGESRCVAEAGPVPADPGEPALVAWVMRTSKAVGMLPSKGVPYDQRIVSVGPGEAIPGVVADGVYLPLQTSTSLEGVLFVNLIGADRPTEDDARLLAAVANLTASSLERQRLSEEASHAEALREADRLKTTLVSSVSHELKTPLAAATARVTGLVEEADSCDAGRLREELNAVAEDLGRLNTSIVDLLDLSRLESDAWRPHLEHHDVSDILGTVRSRLPVSQRERVRFSLADGLPTVHVDFAQLARALTNLVENALVYSPAGEPVMVGSARHGDDVDIWIEDRGPGVTGEEKTCVFEKFYRGTASASSPAGTGLGLTIAQEIARSHGGRLRVEDAEPHGARFVLTLPAGLEEEGS